MGDNVYPCIIYQRLRPSAPEASQHAFEHIWPLAHELVERAGYTLCGLYGDSEFAAPFCGSSEIRPGFEAALARAGKIAAKLGGCTLLVGNAAAIGDGDPFLPPFDPLDAERGIQVQLVNFHLRPHAKSTSLSSAWRAFEQHKRRQPAGAAARSTTLMDDTTEVDVAIHVDNRRMLAQLYLTNPTEQAVSVQWKLLVQRTNPWMPVNLVSWSSLVIPPKRGAYLTTVWQGELPWVRQLRVKHTIAGVKLLGAVHFAPADLARRRLTLVWERSG